MTVKIINIVYPPGCGGNHVANMIALDKKYPLTIDTSVYDNLNDVNVHQPGVRENDLVKINLYHMGELIFNLRNDRFSAGSTNILILLPDNFAGLAFQRLSLWASEYKNMFIYHEHKNIYSKFVISKITDLEWTTVDSDMLFRKDLSYLLSILKTLGINIDIARAAVCHNKWLDKVKNYIKTQTSHKSGEQV